MIISSDTTKDYSSVQRFIDSEREKEFKYPKRRKIEINSNNEDINDPALDDNQSDGENRSIFTQNLMFQNRTPVKQRLNESMRQDIQREIVAEPLVSPLSNPGTFIQEK